jgi:sensor histidine kinase YesM
VELAFCIIIAAFASTTITLVSHAISAYEHTLRSVLISNIMIGSVINLIIIIFLEAWNWYWAREQSEAEKHSLESELKLMRFEILKQQINPHFMFNSLNVLSGLVRKDAELAEEFIEAFADVYRYVVETIDKPTVTLQEELEFAKSYFFLQQIRHGQSIDWKINISTSFLPYHLPPLSLQLLIENAIKHNAFSPGQKLIIDISTENEWLCISNNLNKKISTVRSAGTGLNNLEKRYSFLTDLVPKFVMMEKEYFAKIPLLTPDE